MAHKVEINLFATMIVCYHMSFRNILMIVWDWLHRRTMYEHFRFLYLGFFFIEDYKYKKKKKKVGWKKTPMSLLTSVI